MERKFICNWASLHQWIGCKMDNRFTNWRVTTPWLIGFQPGFSKLHWVSDHTRHLLDYGPDYKCAIYKLWSSIIILTHSMELSTHSSGLDRIDKCDCRAFFLISNSKYSYCRSKRWYPNLLCNNLWRPRIAKMASSLHNQQNFIGFSNNYRNIEYKNLSYWSLYEFSFCWIYFKHI